MTENITFGDTSGEDYIIQDYIDDGVPSRPHRKNMLNAIFKQTGIAYCKHKEHGGMLVVVFADGFRANKIGKAAVLARAIN